MSMLLPKRIFTAIGCFIPTAVIFFLGIAMIGGMIVGGIAGAKAGNSADGAAAGRLAGEQFGQQYGGITLIGALVLAAMAVIILTFGGILPWCRKPREENTQQPPTGY